MKSQEHVKKKKSTTSKNLKMLVTEKQFEFINKFIISEQIKSSLKNNGRK
jgi:hypothetical protein